MNLGITTLNNLTKRNNYSGPVILAQQTKGQYMDERTKKIKMKCTIRWHANFIYILFG